MGSAYAQFGEDDKGSLEPGKLADLAVLSQDIFSVPPRSASGNNLAADPGRRQGGVARSGILTPPSRLRGRGRGRGCVV